MKSRNIAYSEEYKECRRKMDYVFDMKYQDKEVRTRIVDDGKHTLITYYYSDFSHGTLDSNVRASRTEIINSKQKIVNEIKNIDYSVDFFSDIKHSNGNSYLFFSIDLYGYSIMDLSNYNVNHYIPVESFKNSQETFIWTDIHYCKHNDLLAVDGCYWASPYGTEFYNITNPMELPFKKVCDSNDLEGIFSTDNDIIPIRWNENGTIILQGFIDDEGMNQVEKTIDIKTLKDII